MGNRYTHRIRTTGRRPASPRAARLPIVVGFIFGLIGFIAAIGPTIAAPGEVGGVMLDDPQNIHWGLTAGAKGYNVYHATLPQLQAGDYGTCHVGSHRATSLTDLNVLSPQGLQIFWVTAIDEAGEGTAGPGPGGARRQFSTPCKPARRHFDFSVNGDTGDGVLDGVEPARNPSLSLYGTSREMTGIYRHSGEFLVTANDLWTASRSGPVGGGTMALPGGAPRDCIAGMDREDTIECSSIDFAPNIPKESATAKLIGRRKHGPVRVTRHVDAASAILSQLIGPAAAGGIDGGFAAFRHLNGTGDLQGRLRTTDLLREAVHPAAGGSSSCRPILPLISPHIGRRDGIPGSWVLGTELPRVQLNSGLEEYEQPTRGYGSQIDYDGPLGHGWDLVANARIKMVLGDVVLHDGRGRADLFLRDTPTTFISPSGVYSILIENPDGSYTKRDPDGTLHNFHGFDGSNLEGAIESVEDRNGNFVSLLYDHQGLLTTVVDTLGRSIDYEYDAAGRITAIVDFAGRRVEYGYSLFGNLFTVRSPVVTGTPNGNDFPAGKVTTYLYSSGFADARLNHNLTGIIRPNDLPAGPPVVQLAYGATPGADDFDRVTAWTIGGDDPDFAMEGGQNSYTHQLVNRGAVPDPVTPRRIVTVVDRNGNMSEFVHNWAGHLLSRTDFTNRDLRPGEPDYTTTHSYSPEGELLETILPEGNRLLFTYDTTCPNRGSRGNLLELRLVPDNPGAGPGRGDGHGGLLADRVWTFTYDDYFNGPLSITDPRGNDPAYLPQNGGPQSPARYTSTIVYDHQEGDPAKNGINALGARFGINPCVTPLGVGDVNGDGLTDQAGGNLVRAQLPSVQLDPQSQQAAIEGDTTQEITTLVRRNGFGQPVEILDPEGNLHQLEYFPETDPDGDGVGAGTPDDGRPLDPTTGGYLKTARFDTTPGTGRNNGTNPPPAAIRVDYQYDQVGNVTGVVDGRGVLTRIAVNALDQMVQVMSAAATADAAAGGEAPTGRGETGLTPHAFVTRFHYDANDNLVRTEAEDRGATRGLGAFIASDMTYDLLDRLRTIAQPAAPGVALLTRYDYDANGNPVQVTQPEGNAHQFAYDERDLPLTRTAGASGPRGGAPSVHKYAYDGNGNLTQSNDALDEQVDFSYDGFDRIARTTDRIGDTFDRHYDPAGKVVRSLFRGPIGGPAPADRTGSTNQDLAEAYFLYDELGRPFRHDRRLFIPSGVSPALTPILSEGPIAPGDPRIDPSDGLITRLYEHDRLSRRSFVVADSGATTRYDYDGAGRLLKATMPLGAETWDYTYDDGSNLVETKETENPTGGGAGLAAEQFLTTAFHDSLGRRTMTVDNVGQTSRVVYDSLGAVTALSDARGPLSGAMILRRSPGHTTESVDINDHGNVTRFTYDGAGRRLTTIQVLTASGEGNGSLIPPPDDQNGFNADGLITTTTAWDGNSLPQSMVDDRGNITTFTYDNLNRLGGIAPDDGTEYQATYDAQGNLVTYVDANGSEFAHGYDPAHRLILVDITPAAGVGGTTRQTFEYDGLGRVTRTTDDNDPSATSDDVTTTHLYDSLSRRFEEGQQVGDGAGASLLHTGIGWLAERLQSDRVHPDARHIAYGYDGAQRLVSVDDLDPAAGQEAAYEYFGLDRIHTRRHTGGPSATMLNLTGDADVGYDGRKRITLLQQADPGSGAVHAAFEQMYDRAGRRTSQRRPHHPDGAGGSDARTETFQYDSAGRLIAFEEGFAGADHILQPPPDDTKTWQLDGTHNWPLMSRNGVDYGATPNNRNLYDEDRIGGSTPDDSVPDDFLDDLSTPTVADGLNFAHDANTNQTFDGRHTLTYDALNRLIVAIRASDDALVGSYSYDAFGRRVSRFAATGPGVTENRRYLYAGAAVIEERDPAVGSIVRQIVYGAGGPVWQRLGSGASHYLLEDPQGSIAALYLSGAAGGALVERVTYDPYGKPQFESPANAPLTDTSRNFVAASGFGNTLLWGGLWYDPELGDRSANVNTDWGGLYIGINDAMGIEPEPFRDVNAAMGVDPQPFHGAGPVSGIDPQPFRNLNAVMGVDPQPFHGASSVSGIDPEPFRNLNAVMGIQPEPFHGAGPVSGIDPIPFHVGAAMGIDPVPFLDLSTAMGIEPSPFLGTGEVSGIDPSPFLGTGAVSGVEPVPFRVYNPNTGQTMGEDAQMRQLMMQDALQKHSRIIGTLSAIMKSLHDTLKAIINNMKA